MLRARRSGIKTDAWTWIADIAGQRLFEPPNVAGWDEERWLDTARLSGRWTAAAQLTEAAAVNEERYSAKETPREAVDEGAALLGRPLADQADPPGAAALRRPGAGGRREDWQKGTYRALRQNALRILIATSPDLQTS